MEKVKLTVQELDNNLQIYNKEDIANMLAVVNGAISGYEAYIDSNTNKTRFDSKFSVELSNGADFQARCFNIHPETDEMIYPLALFEIVKEAEESEESVREYTETDEPTEVDNSLMLLFRLKFISTQGDIITVLKQCRDFADMLKKLVKVREKREKIYNS